MCQIGVPPLQISWSVLGSSPTPWEIPLIGTMLMIRLSGVKSSTPKSCFIWWSTWWEMCWWRSTTSQNNLPVATQKELMPHNCHHFTGSSMHHGSRVHAIHLRDLYNGPLTAVACDTTEPLRQARKQMGLQVVYKPPWCCCGSLPV